MQLKMTMYYQMCVVTYGQVTEKVLTQTDFRKCLADKLLGVYWSSFFLHTYINSPYLFNSFLCGGRDDIAVLAGNAFWKFFQNLHMSLRRRLMMT